MLPVADGSPDLILVTIAGKCSPVCSGTSSRGALSEEALTRFLVDQLHQYGHRVQIIAGSTLSQPDHRLPSSAHDYPWVKAEFRRVITRIPGVKIAFIGYFDGVALTHQLARDFPDVNVNLIVDLDGQCRDRNATELTLLSSGKNEPDRIPANVYSNLELQTESCEISQQYGGTLFSPNPDRIRNRRDDGSRRGIRTLSVPGSLSGDRTAYYILESVMGLFTKAFPAH